VKLMPAGEGKTDHAKVKKTKGRRKPRRHDRTLGFADAWKGRDSRHRGQGPPIQKVRSSNLLLLRKMRHGPGDEGQKRSEEKREGGVTNQASGGPRKKGEQTRKWKARCLKKNRKIYFSSAYFAIASERKGRGDGTS